MIPCWDNLNKLTVSRSGKLTLNGTTRYEFGTCAYCGDETLFQLYRKHKRTDVYCSKDCFAAARTTTGISQKQKQRKWSATRLAKRSTWVCQLYRCASTRAKKKGLEFTLSYEWVSDHLTLGCALTGVSFVKGVGATHMFSPSIDRIDPKMGYTADNCRMILFCLNSFKGTGTDENMAVIARAFLNKYDQLDRSIKQENGINTRSQVEVQDLSVQPTFH